MRTDIISFYLAHFSPRSLSKGRLKEIVTGLSRTRTLKIYPFMANNKIFYDIYFMTTKSCLMLYRKVLQNNVKTPTFIKSSVSKRSKKASKITFNYV